MLGKLLDGRYRVIQVLSAGGFGETYIAEDIRRPGNPRCVLKLLKPGSSDPYYLQTARRLFNSEAEILEKLGNHDQIPRLLAYFEENEEFCLVQELIVGHPLSAEMRIGQPWPESQVVQMLYDVLGILEFIHSYGVIHRDIKPDNLIRRDADGKLVLIDFGAVKQIRSQLAASPSQMVATVAIGTPGYMSAEQAQGKPRPNSDIYALGMIAIQALTGMLPTQLQENPLTGEVIWQQQARVSPELAAIVQKMVRYHYRDRYQEAAEVLQNLQQLYYPLPPTLPSASFRSFQPTTPQAGNTHSPVSQVTDNCVSLSETTLPAWLDKTFSVAKFLPFVGAVGILLFKAATWIILLGTGLASLGAGLFFLRSSYPRLTKDYDTVFAVVFCLCGILLFFQEYEPYRTQEIPVSQFLLAGTAIFAIAECIRWRGFHK
jgi:serine/threonine-protein kinase